MRVQKLLLVSVFAVAVFMMAQTGSADEWRIHFGLSYVGGLSDVVDFYEREIEDDGYEYDSTWEVPVGLSLGASYEFSHGSRIGLDLGPAYVIYVEEMGGDASYSHWDVPLGLSYGFTFVPDAETSPYVRAGLRYHVTDGDFVDSSDPGVFGAFGVEFMRSKPVGFGFEVGYDSSTVTLLGDVAAEEVETGGLLVSVFADF